MAFPADYTLLMTYTLPTMTGTTTDFPLLLRFDDFTTEALALLDAGGGDLRIGADESGSTQMPVDVQRFTKSSGGIEVWTKVPSASTGAVIYIWGDNTGDSQPGAATTYGSQAVWSNFDLVIHQGTAVDATGTHTVTLNGSPSLTSMLWGGQGYNIASSGQYLAVTHAATLNIQKDFSVDAWVDVGIIPDGDAALIIDKTDANANGFLLTASAGTLPPSGISRIRSPNLTNANMDMANQNGLQRISGNFNGTTREMIRDGVVENSDTPTGTVTNNTVDAIIGNRYDFIRPLRGILGEFWLSIPSRNPNRTDEQANQASVGAWGTPANADTPLSVSDTVSNVDITSLNETVTLLGQIQVTDTLINVNISSLDESVSIVGNINVSDSAANVNITSLNETVSTVGNIVVDDSLANIDVSSLNETVTLAAIISVNDSLSNTNITPINETVTIGGAVDVSDTVSSINVTSINESVLAVGQINVSDTLVNINITSLDETIVLSTPVVVNDGVVTINVSPLNDTVLIAGAVNVQDSVANIDINVYRPTITIGEAVITPSTYTITFKEDGYSIEFKPDDYTIEFGD